MEIEKELRSCTDEGPFLARSWRVTESKARLDSAKMAIHGNLAFDLVTRRDPAH